MKNITMQNIDKEIHEVMESQFSYAALEKFVLLSRAKKYLCRMHHEFSEHDAMEWARKMSPAPKWTVDQTTAVMAQKGYNHNKWEFYAVMNSLYSDYGKTVAKYGIDKPEFWAELAEDFLDDTDAVENKTAKYFEYIVV